MNKIRVFIDGIPKAQPRARSVSGRSGVYNPKTADQWKLAVKAKKYKMKEYFL